MGCRDPRLKLSLTITIRGVIENYYNITWGQPPGRKPGQPPSQPPGQPSGKPPGQTPSQPPSQPSGQTPGQTPSVQLLLIACEVTNG